MSEKEDLALPPGLKQAIQSTVNTTVRKSIETTLEEILKNDDVFDLVSMRMAFEQCQEKLQNASYQIADMKTNVDISHELVGILKEKVEDLTKEVAALSNARGGDS